MKLFPKIHTIPQQQFFLSREKVHDCARRRLRFISSTLLLPVKKTPRQASQLYLIGLPVCLSGCLANKVVLCACVAKVAGTEANVHEWEEKKRGKLK